jgi:RES domain-containing protein
MLLYRICKSEYADDLSGHGAYLFGGRWNRSGHAMLYTSQTASLAVLELLVHTDARFLGGDFSMIELALEEQESLPSLDEAQLPANWREYPAPPQLQRLGTDWLLNGPTAVLSVPSVINPLERNFLINPAKLKKDQLIIRAKVAFQFDRRFYESRW